ncbi:MAG TPA: hypothetical protein VIF09_03955 [Polyangiaceae bacterium]|jgi:hypothetical protein
MGALGVSELLVAWERAYGQRPAMRALTLVAAASGGDEGDPRRLSVGDRDVRLLAVRESVFGDALESTADCAACGETMELSFRTSDVRAPRTALPGPLAVEGYEVEWRLPTSGDLAELRPDEAPDAARARLVEGCVVRARRGEEDVLPRDLPAAVREALARAVESADPQADVALTAPCPECGHSNEVPFDVATFFWEELNAWALRTLQDVHTLACAYGWSEREVLSMTSFRRQLYLEMLGS